MKKLTESQLEKLAMTSDRELLNEFPGFTRAYLRGVKAKLPPIKDIIAKDRKFESLKDDYSLVESKYKKLLELNKFVEDKYDALLSLNNYDDTFVIEPKEKSETGEATAVLLLSDVHYEEKVLKSATNGLNEYNLEIADKRLNNFFTNSVKMINIQKTAIKINHIILALLGDFISGNIHEELLENTNLLPMEAIIAVQSRIIAGIEYLLANTDCDITIPCHSGNHARITDKVHIATEKGNSLEYLMFHSIAARFSGEKRVKFLISESYLSYVKVYDWTIRFQHGHFIKFNGGVGGIYIPINKSIAQWNKSKHADIDCIAHYHQFKDGGNFITNGSVIGCNSYSISKIKGDYEEPKQGFFLIDKKRGKTIVAPIFLDK